MNGRLQVVATPIGNLRDLSERARAALAAADVIAAEDTRHSGALLRTLGIARPLVSLHEHNEPQRAAQLLARLERGETVVLVSDAGMPLLSDPGLELVQRAAAAGYEVQVLPGPSAITAALAVAGLPTDRFCFEGFLPARAAARRSALAALAGETRTLVLFEAPHRLTATLDDMALEFGGERAAVVVRELTKMHESVYRGSLKELAQRARNEANFARGELTLVVHGATARRGSDERELRRTVEILSKELPPGRVAAVAAQLTGSPRAAAYQLVTRRSASQVDAGEEDAP